MQEYRRSLAFDTLMRSGSSCGSNSILYNGNSTLPSSGFQHGQQQSHHQHQSQQHLKRPKSARNSKRDSHNDVSPSQNDLLMCKSLNASSGSLSSSVSLSDRSASTDCIEEFIADAPFAGKFSIKFSIRLRCLSSYSFSSFHFYSVDA